MLAGQSGCGREDWQHSPLQSLGTADTRPEAPRTRPLAHSPSTETSRRRTRSVLLPTRMMGMFSDCRVRRSWIRSSEALSKLPRSVTE